MAPRNKKRLLIQDELLTADVPEPVPNAADPVDWNDIRMLLLKQSDIFLVHLVIVCKAFGGSVTIEELRRSGLNYHGLSQIANRAAALQIVHFDGVTIKLK